MKTMMYTFAATLVLSAPAMAQTLSQSTGVLAIAPTASTVSGTSATQIRPASGTAASGSLQVTTGTAVSPMLAIAAATNSSSGTK